MAKVVEEYVYTITLNADEYDIIELALSAYYQDVVNSGYSSEVIHNVNVLARDIERD